jgi:pilus assembly protein CpaC
MNLRALAFLLLLTPSANFFAQQRRALQPTAAALVAAGPVPAPAIQSTAAANELHIPVGRSVVLTSAAPLRRVYVGNPAVLQTYTSGTTEVVLTAKAPGVSSMVLWDESGADRLYSVYADLDPIALRTSLAMAFPTSIIHADTSEGRIALTGSVATQADSDAALKLASVYAKDVVNSLQIVPIHGKQVELKLRIVEVDRTKLEQFGINFFNGGRTPSSTSTQQFSSGAATSGSAVTVSDPLNIFLYSNKLNLGVTIKDLEQHQVLQVLAEPTLTTLSGLPAQFLSGGEFPFPVVQGGTGSSTAISIQFRPYGVKVAFTPTVNPDGSIHLKLSPEVSTLDYSNAVTISGFTIPALSTRRADTEVEIQDGQSFIVSGLLDHRTTEIMSKVPGIGNVPILGQLFRSKNFNHSVIELVIIVTATVVDPLSSAPQPASAEPQFIIPNLDVPAFDASVKAAGGKKSASASPPANTVAQPTSGSKP